MVTTSPLHIIVRYVNSVSTIINFGKEGIAYGVGEMKAEC